MNELFEPASVIKIQVERAKKRFVEQHFLDFVIAIRESFRAVRYEYIGK
jgi:hypothetical protein